MLPKKLQAGTEAAGVPDVGNIECIVREPRHRAGRSSYRVSYCQYITTPSAR